MKEILDVVHKTIYQFFDVCGDDEEVPLSDKDKLLLKVNKAICNNLKALEQESCGDVISRQLVVEFVEYIQSIKDKHNDEGSPINYGTICDLVIRGWKLVERKE